MHGFYTGRLTARGGREMILRPRNVTEVEFMLPRQDGKGDRKVDLVDYVEIPCGQCEVCKANQARKKAERATAEAATWEHNEVINLTYNDEHLPYNTRADGKKVPTLKYKDVQDFKKRLLKYWKEKYGQEGIRFMCACEYGEKHQRPHYHMIMFNFECEDKYDWGYTKKGSKEYRSPTIEKIWGKGNVTLGDVTPETIQYVANYCLKKFKGKKAKGIYEKMGIEPESVKSSNRKGLGALFYEKHKETYLEHGKCFVGTENGLKTISSNKYFDKLLANEYGDKLLEEKKLKRMLLAQARETTRAALSGVSIEEQRKNDERLFLEKIQKAKKRNFEMSG